MAACFKFSVRPMSRFSSMTVHFCLPALWYELWCGNGCRSRKFEGKEKITTPSRNTATMGWQATEHLN
jgi:hypothetical protein